MIAECEKVATQFLMRHGPWAFGCVVLGYVFYAYALIPMSEERDMFVKTLQTTADKNSASMQSIAESTAAVKDALTRQEDTLERLYDEIEHQTELRVVAMETMTAFTERVKEERGERTILIEKLIQSIDRTNVPE